MEFIIVLGTAIVMMSLIFAGLSLNIIFKKNGKFPETSIGRNKNLRKRGITCAKHDEIVCQGKTERGGSCCC